MERTANCGFFSCGQQQRGLQEAAQEQLSSNYCLQRTNKTPKPPHPPLPLPSQHHQIFSFRLNSFRSTNPSHQPNPLPLQTLVETPTKLLNFRSCQKAPPIMHENPARPRQTQRIFRSPPPNLQMQLLRQQRSPEVKRSMMLPSSYQQQNVRITFTTPMEENQSQVDGYSKHSEHTHYTSKKSDIHLSSQAKGFSNENEVDFGDRWTFIADKCPTQKSCIFGNGGETQRTLIDYLNEDQPPQNIDEQLNNRHYDYTPHPYSNPTANYSPILEHQALRSHHQTVTVRTKPTTVHAIPYRINV